MFLTTKALILRETKYKESDKILTLLTDSEGKLTAKARGVLRTKSKLASAIQLFSFSELTLFGSRGRWVINEASTIEEFRGLRNDLDRLALAGYISELLEAVSDEDFPSVSIMTLGLNTLYAISRGLHDLKLIKAVFELRLALLAGYCPAVYECENCGKTDILTAMLYPEMGIILCEDCVSPGGTEISNTVLSAMRFVLGAPDKKVFSFSLDSASLAQFSAVCENYILGVLGRGFKSLDYYRRIAQSD